MSAAAGALAWRGGWGDGLRYGGLGLPLAFVALPLYVHLPHHYASSFGVPLATLGALLLAARLIDAIADPWIGLGVDRLLGRRSAWRLAVVVPAAVALAAGFHLLFFPPTRAPDALLAWAGALLVLTYLSYSVLSLLHQAWGARLGGGAAQRTRIVAWREGLALVGVVVASLLPSGLGLQATSATFAFLLAIGLALLWQAPRTAPVDAPTASTWSLPWASPAFRRLLLVYLVNGVAAAVPATLVLFFVRDRLELPAYEPLFLGVYFVAGALSMPLWVRLVGRIGLAPAWLTGMGLAVAAFVWVATLGAGDLLPFVVVCLASGLALGADLALPGALLTGVIQRSGHAGGREGAYFGWWNLATKLNLALAAGLALPLLALAGYAPGSRDADALRALGLAYGLLPCTLKLAAAALLLGLRIGHGENSTQTKD